MDYGLAQMESVSGDLQIENKIREFVAKKLLNTEGEFPLGNDASFLGQAGLDSLALLELVALASREFGVQVSGGEVTPMNFDSVNRLAAYIRRKQTDLNR